MKTAFKKSFAKDLKRHGKNKKLLTRIQEIILEVEAAEGFTTINNLKKLKAEGSYFRIRSGNYRLGLIKETVASACSGFSPFGRLRVLRCLRSQPDLF